MKKTGSKKVWYAVLICMLTMVMALGVPSAASAKTVRKTVSVKKNGDITKKLQSALDLAKKSKKNEYEITVKPGTYKINGTLKIYSNTTLYMEGVTFKRVKNNVVMLRFGGNKNYKKYTQAKNVKLVGGTWNGSGKNGDLMRFGHGQNLTFEGVTFTNLKSAHHIEIAACKDVLFTGCTFKNYKGKMGSTHVEALQIDIMRSEHFNYYPSYDETPCQNVTVTGCTFDGLNSGVGTHSAVVGSYHKNIQIVNNTFTDINGYAAIGMGWKDSKINNNTIKDCGMGIVYRTVSTNMSSVYKPKKGKFKTELNLNCEISGNTIEIVRTEYRERISAIKVYGVKLNKKKKQVPKGDYRISGMTISDNTIVQNIQGVAVVLDGVMDSTIQNNHITCNFRAQGFNMGGDGGSALRIQNGGSNIVTGNMLVNQEKNAYGSNVYGICIYKSSDNSTFSGNTVADFTRDGIVVKESDNVVLNGNTITGSGRYALIVHDQSSLQYGENRVSGSRKRDFCIVGGSTINGFSQWKAFTDSLVGA